MPKYVWVLTTTFNDYGGDRDSFLSVHATFKGAEAASMTAIEKKVGVQFDKRKVRHKHYGDHDLHRFSYRDDFWKDYFWDVQKVMGRLCENLVGFAESFWPEDDRLMKGHQGDKFLSAGFFVGDGKGGIVHIPDHLDEGPHDPVNPNDEEPDKIEGYRKWGKCADCDAVGRLLFNGTPVCRDHWNTRVAAEKKVRETPKEQRTRCDCGARIEERNIEGGYDQYTCGSVYDFARGCWFKKCGSGSQ